MSLSQSSWQLVVGFTIALCSSAARAAADELKEHGNPHVCRTRTTSVAVFKSGYGFFMREGAAQFDKGWCMMEEIPPAVFGTFAVYARDAEQTVDLIGSGPGEVVSFDGHDVADSPEARRERLSAWIGLEAEVVYRENGGKRAISGRLEAIDGAFTIVAAEANRVAVPVLDIESVRVLNLPLRLRVVDNDGAPAEAGTLGMAYLREGIIWLPEYTLQIIDGQTAELTLRGTLINEAEDLIHTDVHFVVGVPHFLHTEYLSPIAIGQTIRTVGTRIAPSVVLSQTVMNRAAIANVPTSQSAVGDSSTLLRHDGSDPIRDAREGLPMLQPDAGSDYAVYTQRDLTVRRGERAIVTLFKRTIRYEHLYRWSPPAPITHNLVLKNDTDTTWTTGPCLIVDGAYALGEDLLTYTSTGGQAELPVTTAINLAQHHTEREVERALKAYKPNDHEYLDLVTIEGVLTLHNLDQREVRVAFALTFPGEPKISPPNANMEMDATKLRLLEREGRINWRDAVPEGETRTWTYRYNRYVPSK